MNFPVEPLKNWFLENRRTLPWREESTPYRVWISEVMLQQTQVSVVLGYFERWMKQFPTVQVLADASLEEVIKTWEGLGYYSRARHLHEAARLIVEKFKGEIPSEVFQLQEIKGLGPYTIGALRSFAFKQKAAAVDGNVIRVLSRYFALTEVVDDPKTLKKLREKAESILPDEEPWLITEGLIELGATICKKDPLCSHCPLSHDCEGFRQNIQKTLPIKRKKQQITTLVRQVGIIVCGNALLLRKGEKGKIMSDLYEFPYLETKVTDFSEIAHLFSKALKREVNYLKSLPKQEHSFTRYRAHLFPYVLEVKEKRSEEIWVEKDKLITLPFSSGHRRILETFLTL